MGGPGSVPSSVKLLPSPQRRTDSGAHTASYAMDTEGSLPGKKRQWREADNSLQSNAKFKKGRSLTSLPFVVMTVCLTN
jgi:hypothetical protein